MAPVGPRDVQRDAQPDARRDEPSILPQARAQRSRCRQEVLRQKEFQEFYASRSNLSFGVICTLNNPFKLNRR